MRARARRPSGHQGQVRICVQTRRPRSRVNSPAAHQPSVGFHWEASGLTRMVVSDGYEANTRCFQLLSYTTVSSPPAVRSMSKARMPVPPLRAALLALHPEDLARWRAPSIGADQVAGSAASRQQQAEAARDLAKGAATYPLRYDLSRIWRKRNSTDGDTSAVRGDRQTRARVQRP